MSGPNGTAPRLEIEQIARRAIERIDKETAEHVAEIDALKREREEMERVLGAIGTTFHWKEGSDQVQDDSGRKRG